MSQDIRAASCCCLVAKLHPSLCDPMDCNTPGSTPLSTGFPRQEYWNGLQFPFAGHLPDPGMPGIKPTSPALEGRFFNTEPPSGQPLEVENGKEWMDYPRASRRNTALLMP